jgi:protein-L-isoaspartate(D-aspartate) O-methyltransferase
MIGYKVTISAPYIHATALEVLAEHLVKPGCRALDVGCGSGVLLGCMARMGEGEGGGEGGEGSSSNNNGGSSSSGGSASGGGASGRMVVGIEVVEELVPFSIANLIKDGLSPNTPAHESKGGSEGSSADNGGNRLIVEHGNGWQGAAKYGPFSAIHVGAAAATMPDALVKQLAPGGRMCIPIGDAREQVLMQVDRSEDGASSPAAPVMHLCVCVCVFGCYRFGGFCWVDLTLATRRR